MLNWFKRKLQLKAIKAATEDIERFNARLRGANSDAVAMVVLYANHCRFILEAERGWNLDYPDLIVADEADALWFVNRSIVHLQKEQSEMTAGMMVWLHTLRASGMPEIVVQGREMWEQLARGVPHVESACISIYHLTGTLLETEGCERIPTNLLPLEG